MSESLFAKIEGMIREILQQEISIVPKDRIALPRTEAKLKAPCITLSNVDFFVKEADIGRAFGGEEVDIEELLDSDGRGLEYALSDKPVRPSVRVEHPTGTNLRESDDYSVDYQRNVIVFQRPPSKGKENILVRYRRPAELKTLKLRIRYHIDAWSEGEAQRDELAVKVMEALLRNENKIAQQHLAIRPLKGFNIASTESGLSGANGKTLEYEVEADLTVVTPLPRMEKIELQEKKKKQP